MMKYDVYGSKVWYDDETDAAEKEQVLLGTFEADDETGARAQAFKSLAPEQRREFSWGNVAFRCLVVENGEKVAKKCKVTDKAMLRTLRREYFSAMSNAERDAYENR